MATTRRPRPQTQPAPTFTARTISTFGTLIALSIAFTVTGVVVSGALVVVKFAARVALGF